MSDIEKKLRVRVAGILVRDNKLLLISHKKNEEVYWLLPGGGVDFGESLDEALIREFSEELNISIEVKKLAFICDSIHPEGQRHILNIFFHCSYNGGRFHIGDEERLLGYSFFELEELKGLRLFPPVNNELISILMNEEIDSYTGKMWRIK